MRNIFSIGAGIALVAAMFVGTPVAQAQILPNAARLQAQIDSLLKVLQSLQERVAKLSTSRNVIVGPATPNVPIAVSPAAPSRLPAPPAARAGFVIPQGKQLVLDGVPWWSKGANWLGAQSVNRYCPLGDGTEMWCNMRYLEADEWDPAAIEADLQWLHEVLGINTLRLNAVGTDANGDWRPGYDTRLLDFTRMAYRQGIRITWTLFFGVPSFECPQPNGTYVSCYLAGKPVPPGAVLMPPGGEFERKTLKAVRNFATLMKDEPGVLAYEVGNEMLLSNARIAGYQEQLLSYVARILAEVRRADPYHFFVSGEVAVLQGPNDPNWPWLEGKGADFVKLPDVHNLNGGEPFSLEDVVDVVGTHMYQRPETVRAATDVVLAAARKPVLFGEFGGGGATNAWEWPEPNEQLRWHAATIAQARRLAGGWVWNPVPFMDFKPGTYRVETWTDNAGGLRPLIVFFGPPERRIKALSFSTYTFAPQDNALNSLSLLPAGRELANRQVQFVSQTVPATMETGRQYPVSITLRNTGDSPWDRGGNAPYAWRLKSWNPADNTTWGINAVPMPPSPVRPGATVTFSFTVTAPTSTGTYNFQWGLNQGAVGWFGNPTPNVGVEVLPQPAPVSCSPETWQVPQGGTAYLSASGGNGSYTWAAPEGGVLLVTAGRQNEFVYRGEDRLPVTKHVTVQSGDSRTAATCTIRIVPVDDMTARPLSCTPAVQSAWNGMPVNVSAVNIPAGTEPSAVVWSAPDGSPSTGTRQTFTVSFVNTTRYVAVNPVSVRVGDRTAICYVRVSNQTAPPTIDRASR